MTAAVNAQQHRLAVNYEGRIPITPRGFSDQRIPITPVVAVAREQPNALALALNNQAVAVVLDFVDPFRSVRKLGAAGRDPGLER